MSAVESCRAEEQESFLVMEDSGIDSDPKHQNMQEDGRLFMVYNQLIIKFNIVKIVLETKV